MQDLGEHTLSFVSHDIVTNDRHTHMAEDQRYDTKGMINCI